uniref:Uncharacterized protein n=1 Tax=Tetradesmus obliquus TaxID=3088 RepID=A0A383VC20_TETOB|eukprot:jgi/Sobl393_1/9037/SZX62483.1
MDRKFRGGSSSSSRTGGLQAVPAAAQQSSEGGAGIESAAAGSTATNAELSHELLQVCVQELCRLAAALSECVDCSSLRVLLLQLPQQLLTGTGSKLADATGSASACAVADLPPPPPLPAEAAAGSTALVHKQRLMLRQEQHMLAGNCAWPCYTYGLLRW